MDMQGIYQGVLKILNADRFGNLLTKHDGGSYDAAVERGNVYGVANQSGVTSQAGLSLTTPVLTLYNPAGSTKNLRVWYVGASMDVANATVSTLLVAVGANTIAAAVTGTLTTAHRNMKMGLASSPVARTFLAATLPAAPVAIAILGAWNTAATTAGQAIPALSRWFNGALILTPGTNLSVQTSAASGTSGLWCDYIWEEVDY